MLEAPDRDELLDWLRARPLMHVEGDYAMVHAGLLPQWSIDEARALASGGRGGAARRRLPRFLAHMYGSKPDRWNDALRAGTACA